MKSVYVCPVDKSLMCSWEGPSEDILDHFIMEHEDLLVDTNDIEVNVDVKSENRLMFFQEEIYLIQLRSDGESLKIALRYLGPNHIAKTLSYDVNVKVDESLYFSDYFNEKASIIQSDSEGWFINLRLLKLLHNLKNFNCILSIKPEDTIRDNDIDMALEELENDGDALDNISCLNLSMFEKNDKIRRFSSFLGLPPGLFDIKEKTDLSCSNCFLNMLPPIFFCLNNHSVCSDCKNQKCRVCYELVTENRNKVLEDFSRKSLHLCRFHKEGCSESFTYYEIRNHELKCNFCTYVCIDDCPFRAKFSDFQSHFKIHHPSCKLHRSTPVDFPKNSEFVVYDRDLGIFHCRSAAAARVYQWVVTYLGPIERNFACDLSFKGGKLKDTLFLKRYDTQYSITQTKDDLKRMKVKEKNAVLTISKYFQ